MIGEIAKLFDRNFAVAFFLPAAGFITATHYIGTRLGTIKPLFILRKESLFENVALFLIATGLVAVILSVLNRGVVRLFEGYWPFRRYLNFVARWRYDRLLRRETSIEQEIEQYSDQEVPTKVNLKRAEILRRKAARFPEQSQHILPTAFGNTFRAFEVYSSVIYGLDAIPGWFRLLGVVPPDYRALMDASRARVDLWINSSFLAILAIVEYTGFSIYTEYKAIVPRQALWWFPILMFAFACLAYRFATSAAVEWGNWVKAAFDLYLPDLRKKLEFPDAAAAKQRDMWIGFSQVAVYRIAAAMPEKVTDQKEEWYDSKEWQDIVKLLKLYVTKNGLELFLAMLQRTDESKTRENSQKKAEAQNT